MIEAYLRHRAASDFDFRPLASPDDPLRHLFDEWVDYYRQKHAIALALQPRNVLEIGVRFGYSALAFLAACPQARYLGLDNGSESFGGASGAMDWARRALAGYDARVERADTQALDTLPGDRWDLVHVDGQQDGDGTLHDLALALEKARYILVDGYFWTRHNLDASTHFLHKYRSLIEYAVVLPGYAGDLLVKVRQDVRFRGRAAADHRAIRDEYTREYFLRDCGGYEAFKAGNGRELADPRLVAMFECGAPWQGLRVLDVGSGRGELAYACHRAGARVVGLDYSPAAVEIAREAYRDALGEGLRFECEDVMAFEPGERFDRILAGDFVEHLDAATLDHALARFARWLAPGGRVVIHTWPNRLAYQARQRQRRRRAAELGIFLPRNQRSLYEDTMHLNEQTPGRLRRALARAFPEVLVWVGSGAEPAAGLQAPASRAMVRGHDSIFAIASNRPIDAAALADRLRQPPLEPAALAGVALAATGAPRRVARGATFAVQVEVRNGSAHPLASLPPHPVHLSYHWLRDGRTDVFDGLRTRLPAPVAAGEVRIVEQRVLAPAEPGVYTLVATLVQEGAFWLDAHLPRSAAVVDGIEVS